MARCRPGSYPRRSSAGSAPARSGFDILERIEETLANASRQMRNADENLPSIVSLLGSSKEDALGLIAALGWKRGVQGRGEAANRYGKGSAREDSPAGAGRSKTRQSNRIPFRRSRGAYCHGLSVERIDFASTNGSGMRAFAKPLLSAGKSAARPYKAQWATRGKTSTARAYRR